jgi:type I restriction enzyme, S subunit
MEFSTLKHSKVKLLDGDRGVNYPKAHEFHDEGETLFLSAKNVTDRGFKFEECQFITESKSSAMGKGLLKRGDVVITTRGTLGNIAYYDDEVPFDSIRINSGMAILRAEGDRISNLFLFQVLRSPQIERQIKRFSFGSAQPQLTLGLLQQLSVPVPTVDEQSKITEILQTWDEAIEKLKALRAKKRIRLTGLSQNLLGRSGRFPNRWELRPLSAISTRVRRQNGGDNHPVMTISAKSGFLMQSDKFSRNMAGRSVDRYIVLHEGEFAYNKGNSLTAPYGCIFLLDRPTALVPFVYFCFALNKGLSHAFYTHLFAAGALNRQLSRLINSGVRNDGLLNLNVDDFFSCKVPMPPIEEQERIARALTAAKDELALLDREIETLTQQKRGLMQKLLTGEWRVTVDASIPSTPAKEKANAG